jgi:GDP-4-dehydro-6-deoxy-D-mannose reductase
MRALVTGAVGFAGSHLCELLLAQGMDVYGVAVPGGPLDNLHEVRASAPRPDALRIVEADIVDGEGLEAALAGIRLDRVFHLAAVSSVRDSMELPAKTFQVNTVGTRNLLEAVRRAGNKPRILVVSSAEAYGESANLGRPLREEDPLLPVSPYGASKAGAEAVALTYAGEFNLDIIRVRPFPHTGPRHAPQFAFADWAHQLAEIEAGRRLPRLHVGNLEVRRDLSDVRDVVVAYALALERGRTGAVYNVCSGRSYTLREVLEAMIGLTRLKVEVTTEGGRLRSQDLKSLVGTAQALHAQTGWEAATPLNRTLGDLLAYWRKRQGVSSFPGPPRSSLNPLDPNAPPSPSSE